MKKVKCYWNLIKAKQGEFVFSIVQDGKVIGYAAEIHLKNARFHANDNARQKIAGGGKKSVHAWVIGEMNEALMDGLKPVSPSQCEDRFFFNECTYNPRRDAFFTDVLSGEDLNPQTIYSDVILFSENKRGAVYYK